MQGAMEMLIRKVRRTSYFEENMKTLYSWSATLRTVLEMSTPAMTDWDYKATVVPIVAFLGEVARQPFPNERNDKMAP
jgi:hypothetical protein